MLDSTGNVPRNRRRADTSRLYLSADQRADVSGAALPATWNWSRDMIRTLLLLGCLAVGGCSDRLTYRVVYHSTSHDYCTQFHRAPLPYDEFASECFQDKQSAIEAANQLDRLAAPPPPRGKSIQVWP